MGRKRDDGEFIMDAHEKSLFARYEEPAALRRGPREEGEEERASRGRGSQLESAQTACESGQTPQHGKRKWHLVARLFRSGAIGQPSRARVHDATPLRLGFEPATSRLRSRDLSTSNLRPRGSAESSPRTDPAGGVRPPRAEELEVITHESLEQPLEQPLEGPLEGPLDEPFGQSAVEALQRDLERVRGSTHQLPRRELQRIRARTAEPLKRHWEREPDMGLTAQYL